MAPADHLPARATTSAGRHDGIDTLTLTGTAGLDATFAPDAGMACCSLRHHGTELLGLNKGLRAYAETGSTMGIPLLHPWANRLGDWTYEALGTGVDLRAVEEIIHRDEHGLPIHGTLPGAWRVVDVSTEGEAARLRTQLEPGLDRAFASAFPFPHRMRLYIEVVEATLRIRTTVLATGEAPVPVAFGFHPYFSLAGLPRASWEIELPVRRRVIVDDRSIPTGEHEQVEPYAGPLGERVFDDGYDRLADPAVFALAGAGRRIEVAFESGFPVAQVYAPIGNDVVCFEPMTARTNALADGTFPVATPAAPYEAGFSVSVRSA